MIAARLLPLQRFFPSVLVNPILHGLADQIDNDSRLQRVQLPTLVAIFVGVGLVAGVRRLRRVRRRIVLFNLVVDQRDAVNHGRRAEQFEAVLDVPGHVDPARIVVAQVDDRRSSCRAFSRSIKRCAAPHISLWLV